MEVTRASFEKVFPRIVELLGQAEFYAIDFEMTGIRTKEDVSAITDAAADCFTEKNKAARRYNLVQFGLCIFVKTSNLGATLPRYNAYPFNFFVFPGDKDSDVVMNVDTVAFLTKHNMDFNKWITQGIPFLSSQEANRRRKKFDEVHGVAAANGDDEGEEIVDASASSPPTSAAAGTASPKKWDQDVLAKVDKSDVDAFTTAMVKASDYAEAAKAAEAADAPAPTPYQLPNFKDKLTLGYMSIYLASLGLTKRSERSGKYVNWFVVQSSSTEKNARVDMERTVGITRMFEAMVASKKPIIAHNCLMDLLFMHHSFNGAAVASLPEFKKILSEQFPTIFDTRFLATHPLVPYDPKTVQNLEGQYQTFALTYGASCAVELPLGFEAYDPAVLRATSRAHEAGYDALMTGKLFLFMCKLLGDGTPASIAKRFGNRVPVYGCLETIQISEPEDKIDHDGPIIEFCFPRNCGLSSTRIDGMLATSELRGRILWNGDRAFVFSPSSARGTLFDKSVAQAAKSLKQVTTRGSVRVLRE
jgi:poly(A)-specific ribonuclease